MVMITFNLLESYNVKVINFSNFFDPVMFYTKYMMNGSVNTILDNIVIYGNKRF